MSPELRRKSFRPARQISSADISSCRQGRDAESIDAILRWAQGASLDAVLWTDLPGNFNDVPKNEFVKAAVNHIQQLPAEGKALAAEYVWRAPNVIVTQA